MSAYERSLPIWPGDPSMVKYAFAAHLFVTTVFCTASARDFSQRFVSPHIALPFCRTKPRVDGHIVEDEWQDAARMVGLLRVGQTDLAPREAVSWLTSDGRTVYFAMRSELPPDGSLVTALEPADDDTDIPTIHDDSVEIWLAPPVTGTDARIFQGLFNAKGAVFDRQMNPSKPWRGTWTVASGMHDGWWHLEGAVPVASLGRDRIRAGESWNVRLGRNWKRPWLQSCWSPLAMHFEERNTMATVSWQEGAPVAQLLRLRLANGQRVSYAVRVRNPHDRDLAVHVRIDSQPRDSQHAYVDEAIAIAAGKSREVVLDHPACLPEETIYTRIHVTQPSSKTVCFHREFEWTLGRSPHAWQLVGKDTTATERFRKSLLFHASFDDGIDGTSAKGDGMGTPDLRQAEAPTFTDGLSGRALLTGRAGTAVSYPNAGNLQITQGTLSFWMRPVDWRGPGEGDNNHPLFTNGMPGKGYFGVQMARQVSPGPYLLYYMIQYPWRDTVVIYAMGEAPTWKSDAWHWIVLTWTSDHVTLYIDGIARGRRTFDPLLSARDLTSERFRIGRAGGVEQTAIDEVMVFNRCFSPAELGEAKAFCRAAAPDVWDAVDFRFGYYPYHDKLKAQVSIAGLSSREMVKKASLALRRIGLGPPLAELEMPEFERDLSELIVTVPELEDGEYQLALTLSPTPPGLTGALTRSFTRQRFEWEHNSIGKSDRILPPFTPIRVKGRAVSTVLREHEMSDVGLWSAVTAKGQSLLASPMRFEARASGQGLTIRPTSFRFLDTSDTCVTAEARFTIGSASARVVSRMAYDGLMWCALEMDGRARLDRLDVVMPVRDKTARLAHICGERSRANFAGSLPTEDGVIWDSTQSLKQEVRGPFTPYIWIGSEERGLCWFAETDRGWVTDGSTPCQQIERTRSAVSIRLRLIQKPTAIGPARRIEFGLQATPVKPMPVRPAHWRRWSAEKLPGSLHFTIAGSTSYAGHTYHDPFPYRRDLAPWRQLAGCRRRGKMNREFIDEWVASYPEELLQGDGRERYTRAVLAGQHMASRQPDRFLLYVQGRGVTFRTPEFQTFQDEWTFSDLNTRTWPTGYRQGLSYSAGPVPSWQDYNLWWLKQQMETFTDGLYFDCFYILPNKDRIMSAAYRLPDGRIQPGLPILEQRQMMKRTAVMYLEADRHPMIGPHMTNATIMPTLSFAQFCLDWEWHYGRSDFQERWSRDHIRAACIGRQAGCASVVIGIGAKGGSAEEVEWLHRTFNGVILTHELIPVWYSANRFLSYQERRDGRPSRKLYCEIRKLLLDIGIGTDACRTYNYWEADYPLRAEGADISSIVHRGRDKTVIVITDWRDGGDLTLSLDTSRLKMEADHAATDFETGEPLPKQEGRLSLELKKHDFRTIVIAH